MNLSIHRGTNEIGGSCVELWSDNTRIVIDFGMPIVDSFRNEFDFKKYSKMSADELVAKSILPNIPGIYQANAQKVDGIIISHPHPDHYGFLNFVGSHVPIFMGAATHDIIKLSGIFTPQVIDLKNVHYFQKDETFQIGDLSITPFWNDHSAFDSYSLLIECDGKRILYTGDFRSHGRKSKVMERFILHPPKDIDYLIMEGTQIGRTKIASKTEYEIENEMTALFKEDKINLISASGQNIDRLVSIFKACLHARKTLVVDVYIAKVLKTLSKYGSFPYPSDSYNIKVLFTRYTSARLSRTNHKEILYEFKNFKVKKEEINADPSKYVILVRNSMVTDLDRMPDVKKGNFIYSMWQGYKIKPDTVNLIAFLNKRGFNYHDIHTSGHADSMYLKEFADAINPKNIIPIHTFHKKDFSSFFTQNVIELDDKEILGM